MGETSAADDTVTKAYCEFLKAAIHQILFERKVYSGSLFERTRAYDASVQRSRHPGVCEYVSASVDALAPGIHAGHVPRVAVVIRSPAGAALERWVFEATVSGGARGEGVDSAALKELKDAFRSVLVKLQYVNADFKELARGSSFEIVAFTRDVTGWNPPPDWYDGSAGDPAVSPSSPALVPVKSVGCAGLNLQAYAEAS
ncbi:unnamed protein product [Pedinophyceae sp. YPF-701]|nr:unnamed protein product [Pedinophyceae sp. YPF-701]